MWRFSKRQSRASEMTNEIPTYRDPFAYNVWEPFYSTTRSFGGMRIVPRYRDSTHPVYGRVVHREPLIRLAERNRALEDISRIYGAENKALESAQPRRRLIQFRFSGGTGRGGASGVNGGNIGSGNNGGNANTVFGVGSGASMTGGSSQNSLTPHHGSFQRLKELIWTERAKELAQQRKAEETAARAAVLKDIANGQSYSTGQQSLSGSPLMDENRSPDAEYQNEGLISFPQSSSAFSPSRSLFPASSSSRSGGLTLPMSASHAKAFPMRQSHFRERNRALLRQSSSPYDLFQRDLRIFNEDQYQQKQEQRKQQQLQELQDQLQQELRQNYLQSESNEPVDFLNFLY